MRVLIVEDDRELAQSLKVALEESGMVAELATDGQEASFLGSTERYDAAVLDLGLPELDGISVLKQWREQGCNFPVLILTGRGRWSDKLAGFGAGADDYLTKPFMHEEVVVRLRALVRRGRRLAFTAQEERILAYLMHQPGVVLSRTDIVEHVYARDSDPDSNALDVLIGRIRRKLGVSMIRTVRGRGFVLAEPEGNDAGGDDDDDVSVDPAP